MPILDLWSKRQKRLKGEETDVYHYDFIPYGLRVQIVQIIRDTFGTDNGPINEYSSNLYEYIHKGLSREYQRFSLKDSYNTHQEAVFSYFLAIQDHEYETALDIIEVFFKIMDTGIRNNLDYERYTTTQCTPDEAIYELNIRFREHAVGYQFESSEIIRVDSTYTHSEIVKPTLALLSNRTFAGANEEYLKAHEHYRHGRNKECLTECLKAFESTMKIICDTKHWTYDEDRDTSKKLVKAIMDNNLIPPYMQSQLTSLRVLLESGVPTIRNRLSGHGQGQILKTVDSETTRYALNLTGSNIIFLIELSEI